jgi:hypothetical protein
MYRTKVVRAGRTPRGEPMAFLQGALKSTSVACVEWPFSKRAGYGALKVRGRLQKANRVACILAHGDPPNPKLEAAHLCGNPLCVNPRHLTWKTRAENTEDIVKQRSGTAFKLKREQVIEIFTRAINGEASKDLADEFSITQRMVDRIRVGDRWGHVTSHLRARSHAA